MNTPKNRKISRRLNNKIAVFQILKREPNLTAQQLQMRAQNAGIHLTLLASYRALRSYRESAGSLEDSGTRCFKVVASILKDATAGEHLTAAQIQQRASEHKLSLHQATVYRVLAKLSAIGLVLVIDRGRQKLYEWRRDEVSHGHLTCIECGRTIEFHQDYLDDTAKQICSQLSYEFFRTEFIVLSLCERCQNR